MRALVCAAVLAAICGLVMLAPPAHGIPAFARKYDMHCTMCHLAYPRLNDFGERYRDNGYSLMGRESEEPPIEKTPVPVSFRTMAGYFRHSESGTGSSAANEVRQFRIDGFDVLGGGTVRPNIGFFAAFLPQITESRGVAGQEATVEQANVVFVTHKRPWAGNLRVGRFEPAYVAISAVRSLTIAPYEVYDFPGAANLALSEPQTGLELVARLRDQWRFAGGFVNGSDSLAARDSPDTGYLRVSRSFRGEGVSSGYRLGAEVIRGKARNITDLPSDTLSPKRTWTRWGLDASLARRQTILLAQYLRGKEDKGLNVFDPTRDYRWRGWFAEADQLLGPMAVGFLRYDSVKTPAEQNASITRWTIGGRWYLEHNLALHAEFSRQRVGPGPVAGGKFKGTDFTLALDLAY